MNIKNTVKSNPQPPNTTPITRSKIESMSEELYLKKKHADCGGDMKYENQLHKLAVLVTCMKCGKKEEIVL